MRPQPNPGVFILTAAALLLLASACTPRAALKPDGMLAPTERLLVKAAPADQALPLITNDSPAGDIFLHTASLPMDPQDPDLAHLQARMQAALDAEKGVGIAAPQVGVNRRFILVQRLDREGKAFQAYLNPSILQASEETVVDWEGCLSVPAGFGQVRRAQAITLQHQGTDGRWLREEVKGFTARIFQHEIDHLDGLLFIERKEAGELVPKDEYRRRKEAEKQGPKKPAGAPPPTQ